MEYNLILDLDNTLIFSLELYNSKINPKNNINRNILTQHNNFLCKLEHDIKEYNVFTRPYLNEFFNIVRNKYNLYVFTLANTIYAEKIISELEKKFNIKIINFWTMDNLKEKNLKKKTLEITNIDLNKTFIIDDNINAWINTQEYLNIIYSVIKFYGYFGKQYISEKFEDINLYEVAIDNEIYKDIINIINTIEKKIEIKTI